MCMKRPNNHPFRQQYNPIKPPLQTVQLSNGREYETENAREWIFAYDLGQRDCFRTMIVRACFVVGGALAAFCVWLLGVL